MITSLIATYWLQDDYCGQTMNNVGYNNKILVWF